MGGRDIKILFKTDLVIRQHNYTKILNLLKEET